MYSPCQRERHRGAAAGSQRGQHPSPQHDDLQEIMGFGIKISLSLSLSLSPPSCEYLVNLNSRTPLIAAFSSVYRSECKRLLLPLLCSARGNRQALSPPHCRPFARLQCRLAMSHSFFLPAFVLVSLLPPCPIPTPLSISLHQMLSSAPPHTRSPIFPSNTLASQIWPRSNPHSRRWIFAAALASSAPPSLEHSRNYACCVSQPVSL